MLIKDNEKNDWYSILDNVLLQSNEEYNNNDNVDVNSLKIDLIKLQINFFYLLNLNKNLCLKCYQLFTYLNNNNNKLSFINNKNYSLHNIANHCIMENQYIDLSLLIKDDYIMKSNSQLYDDNDNSSSSECFEFDHFSLIKVYVCSFFLLD